MMGRNFQGGPEMIRINGARIRQLREEKGLTQLYIATCVEVTTDTVSRWENKRYPSIKKENGLRLAEALEVSLDEICEPESAPTGIQPDSEPAVQDTPRSISIRLRTFLIAFPIVLLVIGGGLYVLHRDAKDLPLDGASVQRTIPAHFVPGQVLPVFVSVSIPQASSASIIVKEQLPPGVEVRSTFPEISGTDMTDNSITWLAKTSGPKSFFYTVVSKDDFEGRLEFSGSARIGSKSPKQLPITGNTSSTAGLHHWADTDRDNRISDAEILAVYDLIDIDAIPWFDVDFIEKMWLGDGYRWDSAQRKFLVAE